MKIKTQGDELVHLLDSFVSSFPIPLDGEVVKMTRETFTEVPQELRAYLFALLLKETIEGKVK